MAGMLHNLATPIASGANLQQPKGSTSVGMPEIHLTDYRYYAYPPLVS